MTPAAAVTEQAVLDALADVVDPELGMSVVALGLVYGVRLDGGRVAVTMTLTAPGCPLHEVIVDWARAAVSRVPGVEDVELTLTFDPPWTPDRIRAGRPFLGRTRRAPWSVLLGAPTGVPVEWPP